MKQLGALAMTTTIFRGEQEMESERFCSVVSRAATRPLLVSLAVLIFGFLSLTPAGATENLSSFDVFMHVKKDGSIFVNEGLVYDFHDSVKQGLVRTFPLRYSNGNNSYLIDIRKMHVTDNVNRPLPFSVAKQGNDLHVSIGDPKRPVTGLKNYRLSYIIRRAFDNSEGVPELVWNVTGKEWSVPIRSATVQLYVPTHIKTSEIKQGGVVGAVSESKAPELIVTRHFTEWKSGLIPPGGEFIIEAGLPKGSLPPPSPVEELGLWILDWWPALLTPLVLGYCVWVIWWHYGRDAGNPGSLSADWNPPTDLPPAEVGTIFDESCDLHDITATLLDLAARGHFKIRQMRREEAPGLSANDFVFIKTSPPSDDPPLRRYEQTFLDAIFDGGKSEQQNLSQLRERLSNKLAPIRDEIYASLIQGGYLLANPANVPKGYLGLAFFLVFVAMCCVVVANQAAVALGIGVFASAAVFAAFSQTMPARTEQGVREFRRSLSFLQFIDRANQQSSAIIAAEDPEVFGRLLPYAIVLGAADKWADLFHNQLVNLPHWYERSEQSEPSSANGNQLSPRHLVSELGSSMRTIEAIMISSRV